MKLFGIVRFGCVQVSLLMFREDLSFGICLFECLFECLFASICLLHAFIALLFSSSLHWFLRCVFLSSFLSWSAMLWHALASLHAISFCPAPPSCK